MNKISKRINNIEESKTVQFTPLLQAMKQKGIPVFDFAVGEPEFETPAEIVESTKKALDQNHTRYSPVAGLPELRSALAKSFEGFDAENIIVSNGSKQSLFGVFQVLCDPGDEVIVPRPYWVSFVEQIKLAGGKPVFVDTVNHQLDIRAIESAVTPRTKAILINSPNNPTGAVYPEKDLRAVLALAQDHNLYIVSDEAYNFFVFDNQTLSSMFDLNKSFDHLIITQSFSKQYNMTGFRIGYIAADEALINALTGFQSHVCGNVCTFAQYGALAAVYMDKDVFVARKASLEKKRDLAYQYASGMFECVRPQGAFYIFPNISKWLNPGESAAWFAADLLDKTGVAVVPGEAFGMNDHIRISYAVSDKQIEQGFEKIAGYLRDRFFV